MGRPARRSDPALAARVRDFVTSAGSVRAAANRLDLVPTTLARSLKREAFARGTQDKIERGLLVDGEKDAGPHSAVQDEVGATDQLLHLLQKLSTLLPSAIRELEVAAKHPDSPARVLGRER